METTEKNALRVSLPSLADFYKNNPDFDILTHDFLAGDTPRLLAADTPLPMADRKQLMAYQRVLRLYPDETVASELLAGNLDSSLKITNLGQSAFVQAYAPRFGVNGEAVAKDVYNNALNVKSRVMHLVASAKTVAASRNFNALLFNPVTDAVSQKFQDLDSYADYFGSLDYCDCDECKSVFGAAAYLVDLLRITDQGITQPNTTIPAGLHLFDRRPDIQQIELTCENTNTLIPYLQIVNNLLAGTLTQALQQSGGLLGGDVYLTLANSYYPFNLPFNLPLQQIKTVLQSKQVTLSDLAPAPANGGPMSVDAARKVLGLSVETMANLKPAAAADLPAVVSANYGLPVTTTNLNGLDQVTVFLKQSSLSLQDLKQVLLENLSAKELFDVSGTYTPSVFGPGMSLDQQGATVTGTYGTDGKLTGSMDGPVFRGRWSSPTQVPPATTGDVELTFTADGASFTGTWSKGLGTPWESTAWNGTRNGASTQGIVPHSLFINAPLAERQYLQIQPADSGDTLPLQSLGTLDRLNRFIRLSALLGWSYADTDWVLRTLIGTGDLSDATFIELAKVKLCQAASGLDPVQLCCMWYDIKTVGMGRGPASVAPFDVLFNSPVILKQTGTFYRPTIASAEWSFQNPLYTGQPALLVVDQDAYKQAGQQAQAAAQVSQGQILILGIPASQDAVSAMAKALFGSVATIELTVPNLSALYRHLTLAKQLNTTIDRYVLLLKLLGYGQTSAGGFLLQSILDRDAVLNILGAAAAIQAAGFTVYDIDYLVNQVTDTAISPYVNSGYRLSAVPEFLNTVRLLLADTLCTPSGFAYSGLTATDSEQVFESLVFGDVLQSGLVVKRAGTLTPADWANIYIGTPLQPGDFTGSLLTAVESGQVFAGLQAQQVITGAGHIVRNLSLIDWSKILIGTNPAPLDATQQAFVLNTLNALQANLTEDQQAFVGSQLDTIRAHQAEVFANQAGAFFSVPASTASLAIDAVRGADGTYLLPFASAASDATTAAARTFLLRASKILMLQRIPALTETQFAGVCTAPQAYELPGDNTYSLRAILTVAKLKSVAQAFGDTDNKLVQYFDAVWSSAPPAADILSETLCAITGWDPPQYASVAAIVLKNTSGCKTLDDVLAVKAVFDLAGDLGIDTYLLQRVNSVISLPATAANWPSYQDVATKLLLTLQTTAGSDAVQDQYKLINGNIEAQKRDAMLFFAISVLGAVWEDIRTPRNLYEFLLIDPENSGCSEISLIEEAINATQLYLQRCRLNLERNVRISTDDIPGVWWEWMMSYRVWEANRKVFVYPENYIDPSLRKSKTSLFSDLESTLMQGEVTSGLVESAYIKYLDDFSLFAKLRYVDAYQTVVHDKERGPVDTLFLFARTQEQPYHFYYITREKVGTCTGDDQHLWTEWKDINIKIDANHVTPVYAFNKLFVFWVELTDTKESGGLTGNTGDATTITTHSNVIRKATIKYSYYNFNGQWVQPQTLVADQVVNVATLESGIYGSFYSQFADADASYWRRVSVIHTQPDNYADGGQFLDEKLIIYFGPLASPSNLSIAPAIPDLEKDSTEVYAFKQMLEDAYFNLEQMLDLNLHGFIPICSHHVLDETLSNPIVLNRGEYLMLPNDTLSAFMMPSFATQINDGVFAVTTTYSTVALNNSNQTAYPAVAAATAPQSVNGSSFIVDPYIDKDQSKAIYAALPNAMPTVIANGYITQAALGQGVPAIAAALSISNTQAQLVQTRFYELFYGAQVLFQNLDHDASIVPVKNQPNTFILDNNDEAFLLTAVNNVIEVTPAVLNPDSFVSATINQTISEAYFKILSTPPNNYILEDGLANPALLKNANPFVIGQLLSIPQPYTEAENVLAVLNATTQTVVQKAFGKIDSGLRISATLTPACFAQSTVDAAASATYFKILSTAPNNYLYADGSVNRNLAINANPLVIAPLLGLQPGAPAVDVVMHVLKMAAHLVIPDSFITVALRPGTSQQYIDTQKSHSYFTILSTAPNNFIRQDGTVDSAMLSGVSNYTMSVLLGADADAFVVAKVFSVLKGEFLPLTLGYVYPDDAAAAPGMYYDHDTIYSLQFKADRISTGAINPISHALTFGGIDSALALRVQQPLVNIRKSFSYLGPTDGTLVAPLEGAVLLPPSITTNQEVDFAGPYGMYYWELFFHTPFLVASMLNANQQFSDAEKWLQYVFNPTAQYEYLTKAAFIAERPQDIDESTMDRLYSVLTTPPNAYINAAGEVTDLIHQASPPLLSMLLGLSLDQATEILNLLNDYYLAKPAVRAWQFEPFRNHTVQSLLDNLTSCAQIAVYNDEPFDPDAIARLRIGAYEKTIMMKYIDNLLDWGDFEFTQYSWESITLARMYYCYANDLLGPKPESLGPCKESQPVSFQDIAAKYGSGEIPQFLIDMEHLSSNAAISLIVGNAAKPYNDLGFYFCIPDNDQLTAYWDRIEDRLYKIRHCLNIDGVAQPLPLFQPPLNPMDLVRASAQGGSVLGVANQQQQNISYYRFPYLLDRARAYTDLVIELGANLLSALEKSDGEALAMLNMNQAKTILNMTLVIRNKQLEGLQNQLAGMQESLLSAQNRNAFYTALLDAGFSGTENAALALMQASIVVQGVTAGIQGVSIAGYLAPCIFGFSDGGMKFGDAINMGAQMLQTTSQILSQQGASLETIAQFQRRAEDWRLQQQIAGFDISQIQEQIASLQTTIASSQQEIDIQKKSIEQNQDLIAFYQNKFTNAELYQWMVGRLSSVYFQAYKMALDTALTAQMAYQYELDRTDSYITFSYWDSLHKGLLAGESLKLSLAQLENAYTENNKRRMEIEKTISLKTLNPEAFYAFTAGPNPGTLLFSLTEELYDRDFPGHYCRRIKSVSASVPAVVGPYQNIHATLTQNTNLVVLTPDKAVVDYAIYQTAPQKSGPAPAQPLPNALRQNWASSQQIVLSKGTDDPGVFVLNFDDPRYLPFEGTGAVSSWTLSMPPETNPIHFSGISDVILTVKYSAKDGGSSFSRDVLGLYAGTDKQYENIRVNSFDLNQAFAGSWYQMFQVPPDAQKIQSMPFPVSDSVVLPNLRNVRLSAIVIDLATTEDAKIASNGDGLVLKVGSVSVAVTVTNNRGTVSDKDLATITAWIGQPWSLDFATDKLDSLCTNGSLDASKLLDAIVFVAYTSAL